MTLNLHTLTLVGFLLLSPFLQLFAQAPTDAIDFDGTDDYVEVADDATLDFTAAGDLYIEFWFKTSSGTGQLGLLNKMTDVTGLPPSGLKGYAVAMDNAGSIGATKSNEISGTVVAGMPTLIYTNANAIQTTTGGFNDGAWHHVAIDLSGSDATLYSIWVDGVLQPKIVLGNTLSQPITNDEPLRIGAFLSNYNLLAGFDLDQFYDGQLDELRIWNTARTEAQLRSHMFQQLEDPTIETTLAAYYSFDDIGASSTTTADLSPNTNTGTLNNSPATVDGLLAFSRGDTDSALSTADASRTINGVTLDDSSANGNDPFDNTQDIYVTVVNDAPNTKSGIAESETSDQFYVIDLFEDAGAAGSYTVDLTFPCGACADGTTVKLYSRASNSTSGWTQVSTDAMASSGMVTFPDVAAFSQFILASTELLSLSPLAISLDGVDDYIEVADNASLDFLSTGDLFIEFWIKTTSTGNIPVVNKLSGNTGYQVYLENNQIYMSKDKNNGNAATLRVTPTAPATYHDGEWHHIAVDISGNNVIGYDGWMDGVKIISESIESNNTPAANDILNDQPLRIGRSGGTSTYGTAELDEIRIWGVERTQAEVRTYMHQQVPTSTAGLVAYYTFDELTGSSTMVTNKSDAGGNTGTLLGGPTTTESLLDFAKGETESILAHANAVNTAKDVTVDESLASTPSNNPFDFPQDIYISRINDNPNTLNGITSPLVASGYYIIDLFENGGAPGTFTVDLTFPCGSCADGAEIVLYSRESNATGAWTQKATADADNTGKVTFQNLTSFSQFILASSETVLPVELTYFTARLREQTVDLYWQTATELNNSGFEVQRQEADKWVKLGFVEGAGQSAAPINYLFTDAAPLPGINYYRLKQIDFDGQANYSDVVSVQMDDKERDQKLQLFPNPTTTGIHLILPTNLAGEASVRLYDQMGRVVLEQQLNDERDYLSLERLSPGLYLLELTDGNRRWQERVMKK